MVETDKLKVQHPDFGARVMDAMLRRHMTVADVHRFFVSQGLKVTPEMVRRYVHGISMPRPEKLDVLANAVGTSAAFLAHGGGEPGPLADRKFDANVVPAAIGTRRIPLLDTIQAGQLTSLGAKYQGEAMEYLLCDLPLSDHSFGLEIDGHSMMPLFQPGDRVIIDQEVAPVAGDFVAARNSEEKATFKKYRPRGINERGQDVFELVPLNEDFPTLYSDRQHLIIIGTMMEHRRYRRR